MGLDMYLNKRYFLKADNKGTVEVSVFNSNYAADTKKIDLGRISEITEKVAYWRKANQIHNWFVEQVQGGVDDCKEYEVSYEQLMKLKDTCLKAIQNKNHYLLPATEGFFFGSTDIDEHYWNDLKETVEVLSSLKPDGFYYYRSSW
jgi:hypothetical protein